MRHAGVTKAARGFGAHAHLCWSYEDFGELRRQIVEFLSEGLAQRQRVCYVAGHTVDRLVEDLRGLDGLGHALSRDALRVVSLDGMYLANHLVDPRRQVRAYEAATEEAIEGGFTGLRVAADVTSLVRVPEQVDAFARYEHLVDLYMARRPLSALCAYNHAELGKEVVAQLACMHPTANAGATPFRLYATPYATASLAGEIDLAGRRLFRLALERAELRQARGEVVIDAAELTFIDHHGLFTLARFARRHNATLVLQGAWAGAARLIELLDVPGVRVEPAA